MSSSRRTLMVWAIGLVVIAAAVLIRLALREAPLERLERSELADGRMHHRGSWHFPRGGPYVLGFHSEGRARLAIDGEVVVRGSGLVTARRVYPPGVVAVDFVAPPGARLVWHPPGRRGPPEYVLASSVSPQPPERARFGPEAGRDLGAGLTALAILGILAGLIGYTFRDTLRQVPRVAWLVYVAIFAVAIAARLVDLDGAGPTWDEDTNWSAGKNYVLNLLELDVRRESWRWNLEHPPVMKYVAGIGALLADGYGPARALSALVLSLGCVFAAAVVRRLFDLPTALLAGLFAALTPHLIAHGKVVGHEAWAALWWSISLWAALRVGDLEPDDRRALVRKMAFLAVLFALAVGSRFVNALVAVPVGILVLVQVPRARRRDAVVLGLLLVPVISAACIYLIWPRVWTDPLLSAQEAWSRLNKTHAPELFYGTMSARPPRWYFLAYLQATAPVALLAGALVWLGAAAAVLWKQRLHGSGRAHLVVALWLLAPLLVALSPVRQDGVRYIIPSVMALSVAAAVGYRQLARWLEPRLPAATAVLGGAVVIYLAVTAWRIHPYYLDYYGEHQGGPAAVNDSRRFEIAWWGEGLDRAIDYLNREAGEGESVFKSCVGPSHLAWMRHDLWAGEVRDPGLADWILVYQPYLPRGRRCAIPADAELVFEARAAGAPLAQVWRRRR